MRIDKGKLCAMTQPSDEHRALNYLAVRYPAIYASLSAVETRVSPLSGTRKVIDVIFSYPNRNPDVTEKFFVRLM